MENINIQEVLEEVDKLNGEYPVEEKKWYSLEPALSRGCSMMFVIGGRGIGKTYQAKKWALKRWLKDGSLFGYVRRKTEEIDATKHNLFDDLLPEYGLETKTKGNKIMIRKIAPEGLKGRELNDYYLENPWEDFGYFFAVNRGHLYKSGSYPKVNLLIFDEFIPENENEHKIIGEVDKFLGIISTVFRHREGKVVCLSNASKIVNPYFQHYNVKSTDFPEGKRFITRENGNVLFELFRDKEIESRMATTTVASIATESFREFSIENKFRDGSNAMVTKKIEGSQPWVKVTDGERVFTIYIGENKRKWWIKDIDSGVQGYSFDRDKIIENALYSNKLINAIKEALDRRDVSFSSADSRSKFIDCLY